mmetsp:Transcript_4424/g.13076  ORF Transcript_4424/g.13076 Transcript_4424/m.13076 type:complete len:365 (+) Transcript_4424:86-1180(+)
MFARRALASAAGRRFASTTPVALVGCGMPGRGMGWYHAKQILDGDIPSATLTDVVEPWFLGGGADGPGGAEFAAFQKEHEGKVRFHTSIADMPKPNGPMMAMVCTRTADMPGYVDELVGAGVSHIFLEKPGAPTVGELGEMKDKCAAAGATVWMGFNKNVTSYVTKGREALAKTPGGEFTLVHHNAYKADELAECFERNAEGMLKNMAIHELALAATFFGMTADTVTGVEDVAGDLRTLGGFTDFARLDFTLANAAGARLRIVADRCGGDGCSAAVAGADGGPLLARDMVDAPRAAAVAARQAEHPEWIGYLVTQEVEYRELKERCAAAALVGAFPEGVASIQVAIEALKLAEYLTPLLAAELA